MRREFKGRFSRTFQKQLSERGRRMARIRWEKWRADANNRPEPEPKMERFYPFEFAIREKLTGEVAWHDLRSVRHVAKASSLVLNFYSPQT